MEKQEKSHWMIKIFLKKARSTKLFILYMGFIVVTACNAQKITTMKKFDIIQYQEKKKNNPSYDGYYLKDSTYIKQLGNKNSGFAEYETPPSPAVFQIYREFYSNGGLKLEGKTFPNDFNKGIWKEYDKQGNLVKEIDYDKGFEYTWEDLVKYLEKRKVDIKDTTNTDIRKENGNWRFSYVEGIYIYDVIIDGKTGKILKDVKNEFEEGS